MHYDNDAQVLILSAAQKAKALGHSYVGSVHLLLAIAEEPGLAGQLLRSTGFDVRLAFQMSALLYGTGTPGLPLPQGFSNELRHNHHHHLPNDRFS